MSDPTDMEESREAIEERISHAMRERLADFKDQADSLTLEGVRRVLEKDLKMKPFALDVHKKFVKQWMEKHFYDSAVSDIITSSEPTLEGAVVSENIEKQRKMEKPRHEDSTITNKMVEDGPFEGKETSGKDSGTTQVDKIEEDEIKKAIEKRVKYFRENSESITMSGVRRLLEEDLKLAKNSLDIYKVFIKKQLDESLSAEVEEPDNGAKTSKPKKSAPAKVNKRKIEEDVSEGSADLSGSGASSGSEEEEKLTSTKKISLEAKTKSLKKQKISAKERKPSGPERKKPSTDSKKKGSSDMDNEAIASDDNHSSSSVEESSKKKRDKPVPVYGKKVEHLKSVIKSCGMTVPPSVYKRAKDAPGSKREAILIKELEGILEREGLSTNPSEKEIKSLKKRKERAKDLEGIDMSNIVSSSRRRAASSFVLPKPQVPIESDEEEDDEDGEEDDSDDENSNSGVSSEGAGESEEDAEESD